MDQDILLELNTLVLSLLGTNCTHNDYETQRENLNSQNTVWEKVDSRMAVDKFKNKYQCDGGCKLCCLTEEIKNIHLLFQNYPNCQDKIPITASFLHQLKDLNTHIEDSMKAFSQLNQIICEENNESCLSLTSDAIRNAYDLNKLINSDRFKWIAESKLPNYFYKNKVYSVFKVCSEGVFGNKVHQLIHKYADQYLKIN